MRNEAKIAILLLLGIWVCEIHNIVYFYFPESSVVKLDLWVDKSYHEEVTPLYYIYELSNILKNVIWVYAFSRMFMYSPKLFKVSVILLLYYMTQFGFYIWNRNTSLVSNFIVYLYITLAIIFILTPDKKTGKIINL